MSEVMKKLVVDLSTGTKQYVDLTPEEIQQQELSAIQVATEKAEREAAEAAKAAAKAAAETKLAALGLTPEEIAAL